MTKPKTTKPKPTKESKAGTYWRPVPLDWELLRRMPREGASLGFHVLAMTVKHVRDELNKGAPEGGKLTSNEIHGRLASMKMAGMIVDVQLLGGKGNGWQRTLKGEAAYEEHTGEKLDTAAPTLELVEGGKS